jgi:hypothetical protein
MSVADDVARLLTESLAAHTRMLQASNVRAETMIIREARAALAALLAALALDPTRSLPAWRAVSARDQIALSNRLLPLYRQIDTEGISQGL